MSVWGPGRCDQNDRSAQNLCCWLSGYCYPSFNFIVRKLIFQANAIVQKCVGTSLVLAHPAWQMMTLSALARLLLSLLYAFQVFLFSPPLIQKLFLKSVSFQLYLAQSDWEHCSARICFPLLAFLQASSYLWVFITALTTGNQQGQVVGRVGNPLALYS